MSSLERISTIVGDDMSNLPMLPERAASIFGRLTWEWATPLLKKGFHRTLEKSDLWRLPDDLQTSRLADQLELVVEGRRTKIERWNSRAATVPDRSWRRRWWRLRKKVGLGTSDGQREFGIAKAIYFDHGWIAWRWWAAVVLKIIGDMLQTFSVLVTRYMINFGAQRYNAAPGQEPPIAHGIGAALGLCFMLVTSTTLVQHFFHITFVCGIAVRSSLCDSIYRRAMRFTNKSRGHIPNSRLITHISADASRLEQVTGFGPLAMTAVIQIVAIIVLLIVQLGVGASASCAVLNPTAALAGIALMLAIVPARGFGRRRPLTIQNS